MGQGLLPHAVGWDRGRSGGTSLKGNIGGERDLRCDTRVTAHIELENSRNHDDGLGPMSILKQRKPQRFGAIGEQAATTVLLVLNNPIAATVLADKEEGGFRRGRFLFVHDTFPFCGAPLAADQKRCNPPRMCPSPHMNARPN